MTVIADIDEETDIVTITNKETGFVCMVPYQVYKDIVELDRVEKINAIMNAPYGTKLRPGGITQIYNTPDVFDMFYEICQEKTRNMK